MGKIYIYMILLLVTSLGASEIKWAKDYDSGLSDAQKQNKPVFFVSSRHTCRYCIMLQDTTFKNKNVIKVLNKNFIAIISYSDEKDYIPKSLWQPGTPALWFLLPSGEPMFQPIMGVIKADDFLKAIQIVKKEFDTQQKVKNK
ncbi:MAG: thioredoxin [Sulfurimonas sp.]|nr:MAG: thioredoxin [Sulfurimonas sp.]